MSVSRFSLVPLACLIFIVQKVVQIGKASINKVPAIWRKDNPINMITDQANV